MESENEDTETSLQMHKLPSVCPFLWGGGGGADAQATLFLSFFVGWGAAQGTTQFVGHKLTRIIQKELQSLIKYFVILIIAFLFLCMPATAPV